MSQRGVPAGGIDEMRIDPQNPATGATGANGVDNSQSAPAKSLQRSVAPEPNDTVQLSSDQATVRQLVSQLDQIPDIRQEQVSALSSSIANGQYNPSNAQVAEALAAQTFGVSEQA
jgi:flagellar biosynthesis anti-sigma factor FlgM